MNEELNIEIKKYRTKIQPLLKIIEKEKDNKDNDVSVKFYIVEVLKEVIIALDELDKRVKNLEDYKSKTDNLEKEYF